MSIDSEQLMAYADGELDPLAARRVERAIAADPALADEVARHRALRDRLALSFAPIAEEPVPERLVALLRSDVVALPTRATPRRPSRWRAAAALAATLVLGVAIGVSVQRGPVTAHGDRLYASGRLAAALDTQLAPNDGTIRTPVSFRDRSGAYCRVFAAPATDGIACRDAGGWALRRTQAAAGEGATAYRQAASADPELMAAAQDMMAGDPLDAAAEAKARVAGWR